MGEGERILRRGDAARRDMREDRPALRNPTLLVVRASCLCCRLGLFVGGHVHPDGSHG